MTSRGARPPRSTTQTARVSRWRVPSVCAASHRVRVVPSVAAVRKRTGLPQAAFAKLLGVSVRTLQEWEQGRRAPSGAARTLLLIATKNPRARLDVA